MGVTGTLDLYDSCARGAATQAALWRHLRHFAVPLWIGQGFSIKEMMTFARHSSIQMTMERYGHLFPSPDHQNAMAEVEAKLLG